MYRTPEYILDTSIVIDLMNEQSAAMTWFSSQSAASASITSITYMEALRGAGNRQQMHNYGRYLSRFLLLHFNHADSVWAVRNFRDFWLSHQIGMNDCIIAAIAVRQQLPLLTLNMRDFEPLPDITVVKPY